MRWLRLFRSFNQRIKLFHSSSESSHPQFDQFTKDHYTKRKPNDPQPDIQFKRDSFEDISSKLSNKDLNDKGYEHNPNHGFIFKDIRKNARYSKFPTIKGIPQLEQDKWRKHDGRLLCFCTPQELCFH